MIRSRAIFFFSYKADKEWLLIFSSNMKNEEKGCRMVGLLGVDPITPKPTSLIIK